MQQLKHIIFQDLLNEPRIFHIARFQFQKYKIFSFWEGTSPSDTPCVCKHAIGADAPPNHPPMSKTDVQPSVVLVY